MISSYVSFSIVNDIVRDTHLFPHVPLFQFCLHMITPPPPLLLILLLPTEMLFIEEWMKHMVEERLQQPQKTWVSWWSW